MDVSVVREPLTYERDAPHSFFYDLARTKLRPEDTSAPARLERHRREMDVELRANPTTALARGGEFAPPLWLVDHFAPANAAGRVLADLIDMAGNLYVLPPGVSSVNIPRISTGVSDNVQNQQGGAVAEIDAQTANAQGSGQVVTIAGDTTISQQLLDQAPAPGVDRILAKDLASNYNQNLDVQMLTGNGLNGTLLGLTNVTGRNTVAGGTGSTIATLWPLIGQMMAAVGNTRLQPVSHIIMAPRRWSWIASSVDSSNRPIASPGTNSPTPPAYPNIGSGNVVKGALDDQGFRPVGPINGCPVWQSGAILTQGTAVNAATDVIFGVRPRDMELYESAPGLMVATNPLSGTLQVRIQLHRYVAFIPDRYPNGIGVLTAIPAPANF